jgi:hypothetical protein
MGYWSSGTEGMDWEARWCERCVHQPEEGFCAVMELHQLWNYDQCAAANDRYEKKPISDPVSEAKLIALSTLIPEKGYEGPIHTWNECRMFHAKPVVPPPTATQMALTELRSLVLPKEDQ